MIESLDMQLFTDLLALGGVGFLGGVLLPFGFRLVGYIVDVVTLLFK